MSGPFRIPSGGRIDRAKPLAFTFDGRALHGCQGDTLASALLANGIHLAGRSFKYHRPRGILTAGSEEPNALVTVDRGGGRITPNVRATQIDLYEGLVATSQNCWPALGWDAAAISDWLAPLLPAGFYYKTFMGPRFLGGSWAWANLWEPLIRRAAGLGRAPHAADPDRYTSRFAHCDLLVVGAGPAGLAAALAAADAGARVIVCDEQAEMGGSLLCESDAHIAGRRAAQWREETLAELAAKERVTLLPRTTAFGYFAQNFIGLAERLTDHLAMPDPERPREKLWQVRAREVVLATGAIEQPLLFPDNDRPGIMLADAARTYAGRYGIRCGTRAVIATACDTAYQAALDLKRAGIEIALIADLRPHASGPVIDAARAAGIAMATATTIAGTRGRRRVRAATTAGVRNDGTLSRIETIACDLLLMCGGWSPTIHLFSQSRGRAAWDEAAQAFLPATSRQSERSAGPARGVFGLGAVLEDGYAAGEHAARTCLGLRAAPRRSPPTVAGEIAMGYAGARDVVRPAEARPRAFVDFQNDVTEKDLALAAREGFRAIEHLKRYTTTGMATDQGKTSNVNALAFVAGQRATSVAEVGHTTFRQPYTPVTFGTLAGISRGSLFDPVRRTPLHAWAEAQGAVFEDVGAWKRARYFPQAGEDMHAAVARECRTVRNAVGIFDASTLGKVEVMGPDAAAFLDRMYATSLATLGIGRCRYGLLLNEAGFVLDDGIIARLAVDRFHVTTTTGGAAGVLNLMEDYLQTEFTDLAAWLTSVTEQWAVIAVQGPNARRVLAPLVEGVDLSGDRFPHMSVAAGRIAGVDMRLFRVSFTGELGYEVNVPAGFGRAVWDAIWQEARKFGACAYGTETMHVLRAEKGYIIVGQETDGTVTPDDLGLGTAARRKTRDFVGRRSLDRPDMVAAGRKQFVGLAASDRAIVLEEGAQITALPAPPRGTPALGHVTSSYLSATLRRSVALALLADGRQRMGKRLFVPMPGGSVAVTVVPPVFYDPTGERVHG